MEEMYALLIQAQEGDKEARDKLIQNNLGLVRHIVKRFSNRGYDTQDLFQIGCIGLIKAVDKFDPSFEVKFSTYAVPMIMGEIKRFLRDDGMVKVSRSLKEQGAIIQRAKELLTQSLGREPTLEEIANQTGFEREEIVMAMDANMEVESIYKSVYQTEGNEIHLVDMLPMEKDVHEDLMNQLLIQQLLDELDEKEKRLIQLRYFDNVTQTEVAKQLGISQVQVSRLEKKILIGLRKNITK